MPYFRYAIVAFKLTVHLLEHNRIIPCRNVLFFYRILNSEIISSTILFNNGSKFQNLSEPVVINLSSVTEVWFILNCLTACVLFLFLKSAIYNTVTYVTSSTVFALNQSQNMKNTGLIALTIRKSVICTGYNTVHQNWKGGK